jgi:hypothetical protein
VGEIENGFKEIVSKSFGSLDNSEYLINGTYFLLMSAKNKKDSINHVIWVFISTLKLKLPHFSPKYYTAFDSWGIITILIIFCEQVIISFPKLVK